MLAAAWVAALALGSAHVRRYESTPSAMGLVPSRWPDASRIPLDARHHTLVMLVHPQCSCTGASVDELEDIMTRSQGLVSAWVLLIAPGGSSGGWERSAIADQARRIPGVHVI